MPYVGLHFEPVAELLRWQLKAVGSISLVGRLSPWNYSTAFCGTTIKTLFHLTSPVSSSPLSSSITPSFFFSNLEKFFFLNPTLHRPGTYLHHSSVSGGALPCRFPPLVGYVLAVYVPAGQNFLIIFFEMVNDGSRNDRLHFGGNSSQNWFWKQSLGAGLCSPSASIDHQLRRYTTLWNINFQRSLKSE